MIDLEKVRINPDDSSLIYEDTEYELDDTLFDIFMAVISEWKAQQDINCILENQIGNSGTVH